MSYTSLYRKYRPDTFAEVKGQEPIVRTLANQIKREKIGHAYLFCGTRGTGKTTAAKIFARAVNCEKPVDGNPCNECATCKSILGGESMNVREIDAASNNGVDNIRDIVDQIKYSPTEGKYKVYIIDEAHMMSTGAFNALLKTLEEPPSYALFILATTEAHKLPITILSRCQRYDFKRISLDTIKGRLKDLCERENVNIEEDALRYIAKCGDGSMRDALSLLERCVSFYFDQTITYDSVLELLGTTDVETYARLLRYISTGEKVAECMDVIEEQVVNGRDLTRFIADFTWYMRNLLLLKNGRNIAELLEITSEQKEAMLHEAQVFTNEQLMRYIEICSELTNKLRYATQTRVLIELEIIRMCKPQMDDDTSAVTDRIRLLEEEIANIKKHGFTPGEEEAPKTEVKEAVYEPAPEAIPDEVKEIVANQKEYIGSLGVLLRNIMDGAYFSLSKSNHLEIVVKDKVDFGALEKRKDEVSEKFSKKLGKSIVVDVVFSDPNVDAAKPYDISKQLELLGVEFEKLD